MYEFDGQRYEKKEDIPDLGSFVSYDGRFNASRPSTYYGLSKDVGKLPKYVSSGSIAFCIDTGDVYMFEATAKTWYKL